MRERFLEDLRFHRFREAMISKYSAAVLTFFAYTWKNAKDVTDDDIRNYLRHIEFKLNWSASTLMIHYSALKFFFESSYPRDFKTLKLYRQRIVKALPEVLSQDEARQIIGNVKDVRFHASGFIFPAGNIKPEAWKIHVIESFFNTSLNKIGYFIEFELTNLVSFYSDIRGFSDATLQISQNPNWTLCKFFACPIFPVINIQWLGLE